jgi:hypothetical protein
MLTRCVLRLAAAGAIVVALTPATATAQTAVPQAIEVPAGYSLFFSAGAVGTQNYICLPAGNSVGWQFVAPQATLVDAAPHRQQLTTHFLSANPKEDGLPRPTWQHSMDSSRVWGRASVTSKDPNFVDADAIPWLLVEVVGAKRGPGGGSFLVGTAYIQRVNTSGGLAPSTGCSTSADIGKLALVPYTADYLFYAADQVW